MSNKAASMDRKNDGIGIIMRYYLRYALWILLAFGFLVCVGAVRAGVALVHV